MKSKLLQILYDMRHQPVVTWITLVGTALTMFLIIVIVMMQQVSVMPFAPESCRPRLLLGASMHIKAIDGKNDSSSGLDYPTARFLYHGLDGVERESFMTRDTETATLKGTTNESFEGQFRKTDAEFFNIFDHTLLYGRYYTPEEADAVMPVAVITQSTARRLFGAEDVVGSSFSFNHIPYTVVGVVKDHSRMALTAASDIFIPTGAADKGMEYGDHFGSFSVALLVKPGVDKQYVRDQVKARYAQFDTELAKEGKKTVYHEAPFDQETIASGISGSNVTPDTAGTRYTYYVIYALLLLVPAINLSTMLQSRLRRRMSEIGVRRAFGCTRARIIRDIISENFIVTLLGGIVGLLLGLIFATTYSGIFDTVGEVMDTPALDVLLNWRIILGAFLACFLLNIISAAVPAWQASRLNPVNAINQQRQ